MACNCGSSGGLKLDEVRKVTFADGTWILVDAESEARGEVVAHGGGTWEVLRGQDALDARTQFAVSGAPQRS